MEIITLVVGPLQTNCYLVIETESKTALIIDPGDDGQYIASKLDSFSVKPIAILLTHGHFDHVLAAGELSLIFGIQVFIHKLDLFLLKSMNRTARYFLKNKINEIVPIRLNYYKDTEDIIKICQFSVKYFQVPGHTPGSTALYFSGAKSIFVGDLMFKDGFVGRTDFRYADKNKLYESISKILNLPSDTIIYSGHGAPSMVSREKNLY